MEIFKKIAIALLLSISVIVIKDEITPVLMQNATYGMPALIKKKNVDNLFIGSSLFRQGVDIYVIENSLEGESYVLSYNGNQPITELYELQYLIDNGVRIENLYVDMYPYTLCAEPEISDEKIFMELSLREKNRLCKMMYESDTLKNRLSAMWSALVSANNEIIVLWPINNVIINKRFYHGGNIAYMPSASDDTLNSLSLPNTDEEFNKAQFSAIISIIELSKENNINLVFVETPKYYTLENSASYQNSIKRFAELLEENDVEYILYEDLKKFDNTNADYYSDLIHMSSEGRKEFTERLGEVIWE